jgi:tRNA nucleotidyltransferase (CCA-adding enzyme)
MNLEALFAHHPQWPAVHRTLTAIQAHGYQALLAGGCVRDALMGRKPHDFDIASNATPEQLRVLFPHALEVGRDFGVTILPERLEQGLLSAGEGFQLEIATFRKDGPYLDGRRPSSIEFASAREDARRRDFTVNALFYDLKTQALLDFVGGQVDLQKKIIRTVGPPELRFTEDKLRLLRAVRFAAQLDFTVDTETLAAVATLATTLAVVSKERIHDEIVKLLNSEQRGKGLDLLVSTRLLWQIVPSYPAVQDSTGPNGEPLPTWLALKKAPVTTPLAVLLALWLKPLGSVVPVRAALKELKFSSSRWSSVVWLLENEGLLARPEHARLALKIKALGSELGPSLEVFCNLQEEAQRGQVNFKRVEHLHNIRAEYLAQGPDGSWTGSLPERLLNGADLKALGFVPGPKMGPVLEEAYNLQLEKTLKSKEQALDWAKLRLSY